MTATAPGAPEDVDETADDRYAGIPVHRNLWTCDNWQRMAEDLMAFQDAVQVALDTEEAGDVLDTIERLKADASSTLGTTLRGTIKDLQQHIEERAQEIAAPQVADARNQAQAAVTDLGQQHQRDRQRWADLETEFRRQLDARDRRCEQYRQWLVEAGINPLTGLCR
jgi:hypothetical protein